MKIQPTLAALTFSILTATTAISAETISFVDIPNLYTNETLENSKLFVPDGPGPFPAVIVMHGSGGLWKNNNPNSGDMNTHFEEWGTRLALAGYTALFIDSYTPRGIVEFAGRRPAENPALDDAICSTRHVRPTDAFSALAWLRDQDNIIDNRIALMGFSHGAESALVTVTDETIPQMQDDWTVRYQPLVGEIYNKDADPPMTVPDQEGFRTVVAYYPGCGFYNYFGKASEATAMRYMPHCPAFVLHGENDFLIDDENYHEALRDKSLLHAMLLNEPETVYPWNDGAESGINPLWHETYDHVGHSFSELDADDEHYDQKLKAIDDVMTWLEFYMKSDGVVDAGVGDWLDYGSVGGSLSPGLTVQSPIQIQPLTVNTPPLFTGAINTTQNPSRLR